MSEGCSPPPRYRDFRFSPANGGECVRCRGSTLHTGSVGRSGMGIAIKMRSFLKFIFVPVMLFALLSPGHASEDQFSMQIKDKLLSEVFQDLAQLSGNDIVFDKGWANQPINTRFVNLSLEQAINKILSNLNHVVIFEQDNIHIKIFGPVSPDNGMNPISPANRYPDRVPAGDGTRPSVSLPMATGQGNDTDESLSEETAESRESETEEEDVNAEDSEEEDVQQTNKMEETGDQGPADETESLPAEDDKETESNDNIN